MPAVEFVVAIPARYAASRLPGKPLRLLGGESLVLHVARRALEAGAREAWVATDDARIAEFLAEDDIPAFFGGARASIFDYSATTGSSGVLHQTACYGAVPVFPAIGDFVDVCRDEGLNGANYTPDDAEDMAKAMHRALNDLETANRLAQANKTASMDLPLAKVVDFHVERLRWDLGKASAPLAQSA